MVWSILIPILTLVAGAIAGFFIGVYYLQNQMKKMQNDPAMLQKMAQQMGHNLNKQQLNKMQQMMKNQKFK